MISKVTSVGLKGLEGYKVCVEVRSMQGTRAFVTVGLPDASVKESKERITAALHSMGYPLLNQRIIINLSPSELKKTGPLYDLSMALGILISMKEITCQCSESTAFLGALSLDGDLRTVEGMLPAVLAAQNVRVDGEIRVQSILCRSLISRHYVISRIFFPSELLTKAFRFPALDKDDLRQEDRNQENLHALRS